MTRSTILQNKIDDAIKKIKLLTKHDRLEVYQIFLDVFQNYTNLPKEEFINDFYYHTYVKSLNIYKPIFESELKGLLNAESNEIVDNYFQIKASLLMLSPEKYITK